MIYYKSNYLSEKTGINAAKWKRWVREFLPPDPLGGLQSGYARQFNLKDAFQVYLGGHLVQILKFNVAEARTILKEIHGWLNKNGFFNLTAGNGGLNRIDNAANHRIYVIPDEKNGFCYVIRSVKSDAYSDTDHGITETFATKLINTTEDPIAQGRVSGARLIGVSSLYRTFLQKIM
jgi:hypothetical protein